MPITALPTPPSRDDPTNFATRADAFLGALPTFATEANALQTDVNAKQSTASTAATTATTQAGIATTAASTATTQAGLATTAASDAIAAFDSFDDRYLGAKSSNPTVDNDGNALIVGALYFNSVAGEMRAWNGSAWSAAYLPAAGYVTLNGTETLTNKTLTAPTITSPSITTPSITESVQAISTNTNAVVSTTYVITANLTLTLPASPSNGQWVDVINRSGVTTPTIARNGNNIQGLAENMTLDLLNASLRLSFVTGQGWVIK